MLDNFIIMCVHVSYMCKGWGHFYFNSGNEMKYIIHSMNGKTAKSFHVDFLNELTEYLLIS